MIIWKPDTCGCLFEVDSFPPNKIIVLETHPEHQDASALAVFKRAVRDNIDNPARQWKKQDGSNMTALEIIALQTTLKAGYGI